MTGSNPCPWEGKYQKSAEEATRLLCNLVTASLGDSPNEQLLTWYIKHRQIDLQRAEADIARAKDLLKGWKP